MKMMPMPLVVIAGLQRANRPRASRGVNVAVGWSTKRIRGAADQRLGDLDLLSCPPSESLATTGTED